MFASLLKRFVTLGEVRFLHGSTYDLHPIFVFHDDSADAIRGSERYFNHADPLLAI